MVIKSMKLKWYKIWFLWKGKIINHSSHFETKNSKTKRNANFSMHTYTSTSKLNTSTRYPNFCNWSTISWQWSKWFIHFYYKLLIYDQWINLHFFSRKSIGGTLVSSLNLYNINRALHIIGDVNDSRFHWYCCKEIFFTGKHIF